MWRAVFLFRFITRLSKSSVWKLASTSATQGGEEGMAGPRTLALAGCSGDILRSLLFLLVVVGVFPGSCSNLMGQEGANQPSPFLKLYFLTYFYTRDFIPLPVHPQFSDSSTSHTASPTHPCLHKVSSPHLPHQTSKLPGASVLLRVKCISSD